MAVKTELLEEIGLTKSEIKVYLALLELGSSTTGPIVDKSKASSSKIYEILDKLMQKFVEWKREKGDPEYAIEYNDVTYQESIRDAHNLYARCGRDMELVDAVLEVSFTHRAHAWRSKPILRAVLHNRFWADVLSKAKTQLKTQQRKEQSKRYASHGAAFETAAALPALG